MDLGWWMTLSGSSNEEETLYWNEHEKVITKSHEKAKESIDPLGTPETF